MALPSTIRMTASYAIASAVRHDKNRGSDDAHPKTVPRTRVPNFSVPLTGGNMRKQDAINNAISKAKDAERERDNDDIVAAAQTARAWAAIAAALDD